MSKIDISKWKAFVVGDVFICETTSPLNPRKVATISGEIPYITRSAYNNGQSNSFGNEEYVCKGECITIGAEGKTAFYQPKNFIPGIKVYTLRNEKLNELNALFLVTILNVLVDNYTYNDARTLDVIKKEIIYLPTNSNGEIAWKFMEEYIKRLQEETELVLVNLQKVIDISQTVDTTQWGYFQIGYLFDIKKGKRLTKANMIPGGIKFVGASGVNNGETNRISNSDNLHPSNVISVCYNGSVGETFYQDAPFWASDDVNVLYPKFELTRNIAMFFIPIIRNTGTSAFKFIDKWTKEIMEKTEIKLPIDNVGSPDWNYMENYINILYTQSKKNLDSLK